MSRRNWSALLLIACLALPFFGYAPALAQTGQQQAAAQGLTLFTRFPFQELSIGDGVTFPLTLRTGGAPQLVQLELDGLPEGWTASFRGDGKAIRAAYVDPEADTGVDLKIETPREVQADTYRFSVRARAADAEAALPLELTVKDKAPSALGLEVDLPTLRGLPDTTLRYDVQLTYDGDQSTTVNLLSEAPRGLEVSFKLAGQDVSSVPLNANETKNLSVEVKPFPDLAAGSYDIRVQAQGGNLQAETVLQAEVTGQPNLALSGPDGRLSGEATIGATTPFKLMLQNNGSAPVRNIELNASQPSGWAVTFEPQQIRELPSGQSVEVTANVKPADQAIAGDYQLTFTARPQDSPARSADFRVTLLTSTLWGVAGVALIAVAVAVVSLAVARFGRR
ncbi:MAG TPA: NEW3 domain-containing protein [Roseiflexaceae bacterium]|nr:NEW3 domain-containing protein [Roseiflexaceae bacterium]